MTLSGIMKKARKDKGLTLRDVAFRTGVSSSYIHAIEKGKILRPKMTILYSLTCFYGLPLDDVCIAASRIPQDVFYKIILNPELIKIIRNY